VPKAKAKVKAAASRAKRKSTTTSTRPTLQEIQLRAYQLYLAKYRQMAAAYPQVIVSQRTLFQIEVNYIQTLESLWTNASALRNFTLSGALSVPTSAGSSSTTINLPNGGGGSVE